MSIAGIRSNRGDFYQTLVALDWALTILSDQDYQWLEIDSITYAVDDVVVGKADGTQIACQCKKNHVDFKAWTIADLAEELEKAFHFLIHNRTSEVRFYSRNNFGALAKLREHSTTQNDEVSYQASLGKEHHATDLDLSARIVQAVPGLSTFEFLRRTKFVTSDELDRMEAFLRERLRNMASNPVVAFNALWTHLNHLGGRIVSDAASGATQHRITKYDLLGILQSAGAILAPPMNLAEIRQSFSSTSAIGRAWRRTIAGQRISSSTISELLAAIDARKKSILLTGLPGSGKTCALLALQEALEERVKASADIVPLFIQSREFADLATSEQRKVHGLSEKWVEKVARMAEDAHVVIVLDSLDVLSIAREHGILSYFLAQIDRLLLISNVTVVTACRDFDRHYDRRISERLWDCELKCQPLNWDSQIAPLLEQLGIACRTIDPITRDLIKNPRELALFVELAQQVGSFNVVTSQALAQRYLETIVRANNALGDTAIRAIETIALEMLKFRSLAMPYQRFTASPSIRRELNSLNVLQETQDGKLTFGHQTLLDVLVISGALRSGVTLSEFIQGLPPVPFVRPSIRSFVAQLAQGDRRDFRKQIRTVLTGSAAFHIRRLVAESFAEQVPQDNDWPMLRDLRDKHRDVFQVIYTLGRAISWHHFWLKHLVPALKAVHDTEGLMAHIHRIAQWSDVDIKGIVSFWKEALSFEWVNSSEIVDRLAVHLSEINSENIALVAPLLRRMIDLPRSEHSFLGRVIARCVAAGVMEDAFLWSYITDGIKDEDLLGYRFDKKLRCHAHEFGDGDDNFFHQRIKESSTLLDLAIESIERWSNVQSKRYGETRIGYRYGFLRETSYNKTHSAGDVDHVDSMGVLFDAVEAAIFSQAKANSEWWKNNRERLCFNHEGALLYFAILACTTSPEANIDLIGRMLCDQKMLEYELTYELSELIHVAFLLLDTATQDAVMATILSIWDEPDSDEESGLWILKARAELILSIPRHLRSTEMQSVVDICEKKVGILVRQPQILSYGGGVVSAPFSFEVFLEVSDQCVLSLLKHYNGHSLWQRNGIDFLTGGEREVGYQLREASSRNPSRFLHLLSINWAEIPESFQDDIMDGAATYLGYRHGNLQTKDMWLPLEEPDAPLLVSHILRELEIRPTKWQHRRSAARALEACANAIDDTKLAERLVFLALDFGGLREDDPIEGDDVDLISLGINMAKGEVAEALMILAGNLQAANTVFPELLMPTLRRFAKDEHPAIRALILRRLPYFQNKMFDLGWELFHISMQNAQGLWWVAEKCLYHCYYSHFEIVRPLLARLRNEGCGKDLETWGRISALSAMAKHIDFPDFLEELLDLNSIEAWQGATAVWTHSDNIRKHRAQCLEGMESGLDADGAVAVLVARKMDCIFREDKFVIIVPIEFIRRYFSILLNDKESKRHGLFGFHEWLNAASQIDPENALSATEIYLDYVSHSKTYLYDRQNSLAQLMTRLFAEAEEREESDYGAMLQRVVSVQDTLLSLGLNSVASWLKAAERP